MLLPEARSTERLALRKPRLSDARAIFERYAQNPTVTRYLVWRPLSELAQTEVFISQALQDWSEGSRFTYVLEGLAGAPNEGVMGMIDLRLVNPHTVDIGYVLAEECWGQGLMSEALSAIASLVLADESIFRLQASCDVDNLASASVLEKAGFLREACLARYAVHPNISDRPRSCHLYARTK